MVVVVVRCGGGEVGVVERHSRLGGHPLEKRGIRLLRCWWRWWRRWMEDRRAGRMASASNNSIWRFGEAHCVEGFRVGWLKREGGGESPALHRACDKARCVTSSTSITLSCWLLLWRLWRRRRKCNRVEICTRRWASHIVRHPLTQYVNKKRVQRPLRRE